MEQEPKSIYTISSPELSDIDGLVEMHVQSWHDAYPNEVLGITGDYIAERIQRFTSAKGRARRAEIIQDANENPDHYMRVAHDQNGRVVGFVDAKIHDGVHELEGLYIDKLAYGSGIATRLCDGALDFLGRENEIILSVVGYNIRAQKFYKKMGFELVEGSERMHKDTIIPIVDMVLKGERR